mmetsp:Transcript_12493/g.35649  ORF Transcript_12493/g.35649 Transcript_12493/m.35649 type:complete len:260 (-) Transcript_12493:830-1609(-)
MLIQELEQGNAQSSRRRSCFCFCFRFYRRGRGNATHRVLHKSPDAEIVLVLAIGIGIRLASSLARLHHLRLISRIARVLFQVVHEQGEEYLVSIDTDSEVVVIVGAELFAADEHSRSLGQLSDELPHILPVADRILASRNENRRDAVVGEVVVRRVSLAILVGVGARLRRGAGPHIKLPELLRLDGLRPVDEVSDGGALGHVSQVHGNSRLVQVLHVRKAEERSHHSRVEQAVVELFPASGLLVAVPEQRVAEGRNEGL